MKWKLFCLLLLLTSTVFAQPSKDEIKKNKIKKWTEERTGDAGEARMTIWYNRKGDDSLWEKGEEKTIIRTTYKSGRLIEKAYLDVNGKMQNKFNFQYNTDGSYKETHTDGSFGMKSYQWFDKKGKLLRSQSPDGNTTTYKYDAKGKLLTVKSDGKNGGVKIDHRYTYNAKGQLVKAERTIDGNKSTNSYEYDSKGRLVKEKETGGWEGEDFESETENEYNEKGLKVKSVLKSKSGGTDSKTKYEYAYEYY